MRAHQRIHTHDRTDGPRLQVARDWLLLCVVLALASLWVFWSDSAPRWTWYAGQWTQAPWTLWTSASAHRSGWHLGANLLTLAALALLGLALRLPRAAVLAWLAAWPVGTLALLLWPGVGDYAGLSGLLHAGVAVVWAWCACHARARPLSFVLMAGLLLKLATEHAWSQPSFFDPGWGFEVITAAHLSGALAGAVSGLLAGLADLAYQRRR